MRKYGWVVVLVFLSGCSNNQPAPEKIVKKEQVTRQVTYHKETKTEDEIKHEKEAEIYNSLPRWIRTNGYIDNGIGAVGIAKKTRYRTMQDISNIAENDAYAKLAKTVHTEVSSVIDQRLAEAKNNDNIDTIKGLKSIIEITVKNIKLSGVIFKDSYLAKDGTYYVWAVLTPKKLDSFTKRAMNKLKKQAIENAENENARKEVEKTFKALGY
jgi:hypothetical protein